MSPSSSLSVQKQIVMATQTIPVWELSTDESGFLMAITFGENEEAVYSASFSGFYYYARVHSEGSEAVSGGRGLKIAEIPRQQEVLTQVEQTHPKLICLRRASHKQEIQGY